MSLVGPAFFGGLPPAPTPVLDAYTTNLIRARSITQRLLSSYTGPLFRIKDTTTTTETDIGYDPATNLVDLSALAVALGAHSGNLAKVYDQSGNAYDYVAGTNGGPQVYTTGTWNGIADFIGTGVSSIYMATGNLPASTYTALTCVGKFSLDNTTTTVVLNEIGNDSTNILGGFFEVSAGVFFVGISGASSSSIYNTYNSTDAALKTRAWRSDRAAGTSAGKNDFFIAGVKQTVISTNVTGSPSTAAFAAVPMTVGARATGPNFGGTMNWVQDAVWGVASADADVTLYSTALA